MIKQLETLTMEEREILFSAPVFISVLASCSFNEINKIDKARAIELSHLKTFTADPILRSYFLKVESDFKSQFEIIAKAYFPFDENRRNALKVQINKVSHILGKLAKTYSQALNKSLERYGKHVKKATHTVFHNFIFPVPIPQLTD